MSGSNWTRRGRWWQGWGHCSALPMRAKLSEAELGWALGGGGHEGRKGWGIVFAHGHMEVQ